MRVLGSPTSILNIDVIFDPLLIFGWDLFPEVRGGGGHLHRKGHTTAGRLSLLGAGSVCWAGEGVPVKIAAAQASVIRMKEVVNW